MRLVFAGICGAVASCGVCSRPAAVLFFDQAPDKAVYDAQLRLHDMYWNGRRLFVQTTRGLGKNP